MAQIQSLDFALSRRYLVYIGNIDKHSPDNKNKLNAYCMFKKKVPNRWFAVRRQAVSRPYLSLYETLPYS